MVGRKHTVKDLLAIALDEPHGRNAVNRLERWRVRVDLQGTHEARRVICEANKRRDRVDMKAPTCASGAIVKKLAEAYSGQFKFRWWCWMWRDDATA